MKIYSSTYRNPEISKVGGKAFKLYSLKQMNLNVPEWIVIDSEELDKVLSDSTNTIDPQNGIKQIQEFNQFEPLMNQLKSHFSNTEEKLFAVRSSAVNEDGSKHSFAGQFESFLYVKFEDIPSFVKKVWESIFSDRIQLYLETNQLKRESIAVIVQEMIDADVSGVGFGINPNTGEKNSKVICSVYGVGEGIVSGSLNADTFLLNSNEIKEEIVAKEKQGKRSSSGSIQYIPVEKELINKPTLSSNQIKELARVLDQLGDQLGAPQDIEFAIQNNHIFLLQTRPITAVNKEQKEVNRIIWDNSNIVESYPGVTTPFTFSYILDAYKQVYMQLALIMGASQKTIDENEYVFGNMLGSINGRVYYNLLSWYKALSLFPGYTLNARYMENMMGVKERFHLPKTRSKSKIVAFYRTMVMVFKIAWNRITIKKQTRFFHKEIQESVDYVNQLDLDSMSAFELLETWTMLNDRLTPNWKAPLINDSFAMLYFGRLQKLIEKYQISDNKNIHNDLLCGSQNIISVEPIHRSIEIAEIIQKNESLNQLFLNNESDHIWSELQSPNNQEIKTKIEKYIDDYGDRCVGELKFESISYKQDPHLFVDMIKALVVQKVSKKSTETGIDQKLRSEAEKELNRSLKGKFFKKRKLLKTLKLARYFVSNRENLRYERTRAFGISRALFGQIGIVFKNEGKLDCERDIWFLTKQEIFQYIGGTCYDTDLKSLVNHRRKTYEKHKEIPAPADRIVTYDGVNLANNFFDKSIENPIDGELHGLGCCPGKVKGKVRIVKDPKEIKSLNGDILVTSSTDPGWVTLFPTTSAIIVERGSLLSHSAIVSREMGIPCIVSVRNLLKTLKTGDLIEMDGSTGEIKILNDE